MESDTFRFILLSFIIPFAGYKVFRFYKKLFNFTEPSIKEQLEKILKK